MRSMRAGSGYVDNQIYAWALVDSFGRFVSGNGSPLFQKFGLEPITGHILGSGKYDFGLNTVDNNGDSVHFSGGSVLVTVVPLDPNGVCVIAYSTPLLTNGTFSVYLKNLNNSCLPVDERFTVQVVARPK
jgi:hypothetical protein